VIDVKAETERYYESAVELLKTLVSYESVLSEPQENMPYGKNCAQCLGAARAYLEKEGFLTAEFDNHAITAAFDEREPQLGILCHLDVVPAGDGWNSDPFTLVQKGNKLIGRGAIDDKGPAAAVITAMRIIKDSGIPIRKNVRLILGSNEENGSSDMEYYRSKEDFPPMLFTPDGSFPIITIEKGMIRCKITSKLPADSSKAIISLEGGTAVNAVPEKASVCLRGFSRGDINRAAEETHLDDITFEITENGDEILIKAKGKSAHASTPQQGRNAAAAIFTLLSRLDFGIGIGFTSVVIVHKPHGQQGVVPIYIKYTHRTLLNIHSRIAGYILSEHLFRCGNKPVFYSRQQLIRIYIILIRIEARQIRHGKIGKLRIGKRLYGIYKLIVNSPRCIGRNLVKAHGSLS